MAFPVLPAKYYLTHFHEFLEFIEQHYWPVLEESHKAFINKFKTLSEDAQCVYVRMVNRKNSIFARGEFEKYTEITLSEDVFSELTRLQFIESVRDEHKLSLIDFYSKKEIQQWFKKCNVSFSAGDSVKKLQEISVKNQSHLDINVLSDLDQLIVQSSRNDLSYLLFLFFGTLQTSLSLYTLRDLGIRHKSQFKQKFKPRYDDVQTAKNEYLLLKALDEIHEDTLDATLNLALSINSAKKSTQQLKGSLLLELANFFEDAHPEKAILTLKESQIYPARQRLAKLYYKLDQKEECRLVLEQIIDKPINDEEILFAEDYLDRKFNKKKTGFLTEALRSAQELNLSEGYLKQPEKGVQDHFEKQGYKATFTENYLWCALFGLVFWNEIFDSEEAALYNSFERSPADLVGEEFYEKFRNQIEEKLTLLKDIKKIEVHILKTVTQNYGKLNDIFQWQPDLAQLMLTFLKNSQQKNVAHVLRTMSQNFLNYHSGFPDLMLQIDDQIRFIEVKAEGDSLRSNQLSKLRLLREAGFDVQVLRVNWVNDPNQTYVVVDIETTGGTAQFHKITEIGAVKIQNGQVIEEFQTLINPGRSIPAFITQLTGITNEMVSEAPRFTDIAEKFSEFTQGSIFVAHNVRFDYGFIQKEFQRLDMNFVRPVLCTVQGMRKHYPGLISYGLKNLCHHFNITLDQHHRAMFDAKAAAELLNLIHLKKTQDQGLV